jgi:hypothetical protein
VREVIDLTTPPVDITTAAGSDGDCGGWGEETSGAAAAFALLASMATGLGVLAGALLF